MVVLGAKLAVLGAKLTVLGVKLAVWGAKLGGSYAGRRAGVVFGASIGAMGGLPGFGGARAATNAMRNAARIVDA